MTYLSLTIESEITPILVHITEHDDSGAIIDDSDSFQESSIERAKARFLAMNIEPCGFSALSLETVWDNEISSQF